MYPVPRTYPSHPCSALGKPQSQLNERKAPSPPDNYTTTPPCFFFSFFSCEPLTTPLPTLPTIEFNSNSPPYRERDMRIKECRITGSSLHHLPTGRNCLFLFFLFFFLVLPNPRSLPCLYSNLMVVVVAVLGFFYICRWGKRRRREEGVEYHSVEKRKGLYFTKFYLLVQYIHM